MGTKLILKVTTDIEVYADALDALNRARKECIALAFQQISAEAHLDRCKFELQVAALAMRERSNA
jgi:transcriptional antiterminator Rof (Rho-off)